jgi:hypothetical protein
VRPLVTEPEAEFGVYHLLGAVSDKSKHIFAGRFAGESRNLPETPLYAKFGSLSMIIFLWPANLPADLRLTWIDIQH